MILRRNAHFSRRCKTDIATSPKLVITLVFFCLCTVSPAFCQDATYQDSWQYMPNSDSLSNGLWDNSPDGSVDPDPPTYMVGSSVTEMAYDATYRDSAASTTFTGPTGSVSISSYADPYTRNEQSLPWNWDNPDEVEYNVSTEHTYYYYQDEPQPDPCPRDMYCMQQPAQVSYKKASTAHAGLWSFIRRIFSFVARRRVSTHSYRRELDGRYYPTCYSVCTQPGLTPAGVYAPYAQCRTTYDTRTGHCLDYISLCKNRARPGYCYPNQGSP